MSQNNGPTAILRSSIELQSAINTLDALLMDGYNMLDNYQVLYIVEQEKISFNERSYLGKSKKDFEKWYWEVSRTLLEKLYFRHHYFHFIKLRSFTSASTIEATIETIFAVHEQHLFALEDVILRIEEQYNLVVRREIADEAKREGILYEMSYSQHSREIKLNGILIAKPDFESENDRFFSFVYANANRVISRQEIEKGTKSVLGKTNSDILKDLGFKGTLRKIFFAGASRDKVLFRNPITKQYASKHDLPPINITELKGNKGNQRGRKGSKAKSRD